MYSFLADVLVVIHLLVVAFVIGGELAVLIGVWRHWRWIRNLFFRVGHLLVIAIVAIDAQLGVVCPLTEWERQLREKAGQPVEEISFMGRLVRALIFYELPEQVFTVVYLLFGLLVLATFIFVPPRWKLSH